MLKNRIRELRTSAKMSQTDLAKRLNLTQQAIGKWEKGLSEPDASCIVSMAELFSVSTDYILGHEKEPAAKGDELTAQEHDLIAAYRAASAEDRAIIDNIVSRYTHEADTSRLA